MLLASGWRILSFREQLQRRGQHQPGNAAATPGSIAWRTHCEPFLPWSGDAELAICKPGYAGPRQTSNSLRISRQASSPTSKLRHAWGRCSYWRHFRVPRSSQMQGPLDSAGVWLCWACRTSNLSDDGRIFHADSASLPGELPEPSRRRTKGGRPMNMQQAPQSSQLTSADVVSIFRDAPRESGLFVDT